MTISWGNKIFILYTTFAISMIVLVYKCCQTNYDLVSANYYDEELAYQQLIDGSARSVEGGHTIQLKQVEQGVLISYGDPLFIDECISGRHEGCVDNIHFLSTMIYTYFKFGFICI